MTVAGIPAAAAQETDRVTQFEGRTLTGPITEITRDGITVMVSGRPTKVEPSNIKMVNFEGESRELTTARRAISEGRLNNALQDLETIDVARLSRPALAADVRYLTAYCTAKLAISGEKGTLDQATTALTDFLASDPTSYHYYAAAELLGDVLVSRGIFDQAERQFAELVASPGAELQQIGRLKMARSQELQGKYDEAVANYRSVEGVESATAAARQSKLSARVGLARCSAFQGDPDAGIRSLQQLILEESSTNLDLYSQIYNALGNCQIEAGRTKAAINAFLHTDLLYYQDSDYHAEALYHLGNLFTSIGKFNEAAEARDKLKNRYASSPWASRRPEGN